MPDLLTILIREIEAHEDAKAEWHDPMAWLTRYQWLNRRYIEVSFSDHEKGEIDVDKVRG